MFYDEFKLASLDNDLIYSRFSTFRDQNKAIHTIAVFVPGIGCSYYNVSDTEYKESLIKDLGSTFLNVGGAFLIVVSAITGRHFMIKAKEENAKITYVVTTPIVQQEKQAETYTSLNFNDAMNNEALKLTAEKMIHGKE